MNNTDLQNLVILREILIKQALRESLVKDLQTLKSDVPPDPIIIIITRKFKVFLLILLLLHFSSWSFYRRWLKTIFLKAL